MLVLENLLLKIVLAFYRCVYYININEYNLWGNDLKILIKCLYFFINEVNYFFFYFLEV